MKPGHVQPCTSCSHSSPTQSDYRINVPFLGHCYPERDVVSDRYPRTVKGTSQKVKNPARTYSLKLTRVQATSRAGHNPLKSWTVHQHIYLARMPYVESTLGNYEPGTYLDRDPLAGKVKKPRKRVRYHPSCDAAACTASPVWSQPQFSSPG
jgi:hypothetical protein